MLNGDGAASRLYINDNTAGATRFAIDGTGNVGIGTTAPSYTLDVDGNINIQTGHKFLLAGNEIAFPSDEGLVGYWSLDDGSGTVAIDGSGTGNNCSLSNMTDDDWIDGVSGKSLDFLTDDRLTCGADTSLNLSTAGTISAWVKASSYDWGEIIQKGKTSTVPAYSFRMMTDNIKFDAWVGGVRYQPIFPTSLNVWNHLVAVFDGATIKLYKNGNLVSTTNAPGAFDSSAGQSLIFGYGGGYSYFDGSIDEVRIYNTALTEAEVKSLYLYPAGNKGLKINARQLAGDLIVDSSGYVGIGTASPTAKLHVQGNLFTSTALFSGSDFSSSDTSNYRNWVNTGSASYTAGTWIDIIPASTLPRGAYIGVFFVDDLNAETGFPGGDENICGMGFFTINTDWSQQISTEFELMCSKRAGAFGVAGNLIIRVMDTDTNQSSGIQVKNDSSFSGGNNLVFGVVAKRIF